MMTKRRLRKNKTSQLKEPAPQTFMAHVMELQSRLFASLAFFLLVACLAYSYFDRIVALIVAPLGNEHELVYLTPAGAFGFMIKVCLYVGLLGAFPVIMFNIFRFLLPAVQTIKMRKAVLYTCLSAILGTLGVTFAYIVSLPAALHFLTGFDFSHIDPMLTIDSYFSFVMTYIFAGAVLFQLPLVVLIIDSFTSLPPGKMMKYQKHILLGSFILSAIVSPTPDVLNQTLLAAPVVVMYQLSIVMIFLKHRRSRRLEKRASRKARKNLVVDASEHKQAKVAPQVFDRHIKVAQTPQNALPAARSSRLMSDIVPSSKGRPSARLYAPPRTIATETNRTGLRHGFASGTSRRSGSIDGVSRRSGSIDGISRRSINPDVTTGSSAALA